MLSTPRSLVRDTSLLFLASFALLPFLACSDGSADEERVEARVPLVEAVAARTGALPLTERLSGVVEARGQVAIRPEIEGRVVDVLVRNGESITVGQPLVRLDDVSLRDRVRQAEAGVRVAEATAKSAQARVAELEAQVTRSRKLAEQDLIPEVDLETLEARVDAARAEADEETARVDEARAVVEERHSALARATVRSPVGGKVGRRDVEVGMLVDPNQALFRVGDTDRVIIEVPLTEDMLSYLVEGQPVQIFPGRGGASSHPDEALHASISRISPFLSEDSFSTVAEIDVDNSSGRLRPGMFVTVDVLYGETEEATLVPSSALWEDPQDGERRIFVVPGDGTGATEDTPQPVEIRQGIEVLAEGRGTVGVRGVEAGERVVTIGQHLISQEDDATVRVRDAEWQQVQDLQSLQREDLLANHMAKQRRLAQEIGAQPPSNADYMNLGKAPQSQNKGEG